ncbi:MAG: hypothetical protein SWH61_02015 [Thermodesulfobacteriota bacterium]|nr:hypothetical protein [Thermodesulfobacteriota bacterium]
MASDQRYYQLTPGRKPIQTLITRTAFLMLGHAFQTAYRVDPAVKKEVDSWPETFTFVMDVEPDGPRMVLVKRNNTLQYLGEREVYNADVVLAVKNVEFGFRMMTGLLSIPRLVFENRQYVKGDLAVVASILRCMNVVVLMMLPGVAGFFLKKVPRLNMQTIKNRVVFYTVGWLGQIK